ncbi:MAG: hypothetical protein WBD40_08460, partial [Tepidisphaeraceae bacterium]
GETPKPRKNMEPSMSPAVQTTLFRRMRYTPVRDALRGRITGRLDIERRLDASGLPSPARVLIRRVTRRTRLWRLERAEVVDELIAHFADGIESGASAEQLIASFGNERAAARLIARAKRRNRGIAWQIFVALRWLVLAFVALYVISGIYFYSGRPSIKVNYVDRLNAPLKNVPASELAWPLYREAIPQLRGERLRINDEGDSLLDAKPGSPHWPEAVAWLQAREGAIELARQGARKPTLGFVFGPEGSQRDPQLLPRSDEWATEIDPLFMTVLLPHLNDLRQIARVLHADSRLAREQGDTARVMQNVEALGGLAGHLHEGEFLITHLVGLGIRDLMLTVIEETLNDAARHPLNPDDLQRLAHQLARPTSASEVMSFTGDRMGIRDVIQRLYTDDGDGDGRLTPEGERLLRSHMIRPLQLAATPLLPVLMGSRRELTEAAEQLFDLADANLARPMRETDWAAYDQQIQRWRDSAIDRVKFAPLIGHWAGFGPMLPALNRAQAIAERYLGRRDGVIIALALELHRQRQGDYPSTLAALAPALLPAVPVDRITGGPLRYRIVDGRPLVYSVGDDRDDDGGRAPLDKSGRPDPSGAARWNVAPEKAADGDWVLYD